MKPRKGAGGAYEAEIDGHSYAFTKWGALQSLDVLAEVSDLVGGPLAAVFANLQKGVKTEVTADLAAAVLSGLTAKLRSNKTAVLDVLKQLCSGETVFCDGKQVVSLDRHYEGRLDHLFRVAYAGLEVQYGSFFDAARGVWEGAGVTKDNDTTQASATLTG